MNILVLLTDLFDAVGGIQTFNRCFIKALDELAEKNNWKITTLVLNDDITTIDRSYIREKWTNYKGYAGNHMHFACSALLKSYKADVVFFGHVNFIPLAIGMHLLNKQLNIILMLHDIEPQERFSLLKRIGLKQVNKFLSNSTSTRDRAVSLEGLDLLQFHIFPCTIDSSINKPILYKSKEELLLPPNPIILTVSRLEKVNRFKNIDLVIKAMPLVIKEIENVFYVVVGDGSDRSRLEQIAKDTGIADRVIFTGKVSSDLLAHYYNICDVFVLPSTNEGFGIVFLEAMYHSKPCIGISTGGIVDIVRHGETGYLAEPNNVEDLVNYLVQLLNDKELQDKIGKAGRERYEKEFSFEIFKERLEKILCK